jgi:trk system potassium uptake protein
MHVVIIGAGEVGSYLAEILVAERHDVAVIESNEAWARALDARLDAMVIAASGVSRTALEQAGVRKADLVLAVTAVDEVNLIACIVAKKAKRSVRAVARVRGEQYYLAKDPVLVAEDLDLDLIISPERAVAQEILTLLRYAGSGEIRYLAGERLVLMGILLGPESPLIQEPLAAVRSELPEQSLVVGVEGKSGLRIPRGDDRLAVDERAYILTLPEHVAEFMILSGRPWYRIENVLVVGGGEIGFVLLRELEQRKLRAVVLEKETARAEWLAGKLNGALVINGDGTDPEVLRERIEEDRTDAAVMLLESDENSLLIGLFAKSLGAKKIISRCDKPAYTALANQLGIDAIVSPKRAVANAILRYVRRGSVEGTVMLGNHEAEVIDLRVPEQPANESIIAEPLKELRFPDGALIGAVVRKGAAFIPNGETVLKRGDELLVVALPRALPAVEKLLA